MDCLQPLRDPHTLGRKPSGEFAVALRAVGGGVLDHPIVLQVAVGPGEYEMVVVVAVVSEKEADQICMVLVGAAFESLNLLEERRPVPRLEFFPLMLGSEIPSSFSPKCFDGHQNSVRPLSIR